MLARIKQVSPGAAARIEQLDMPLDCAVFVLLDEIAGRLGEIQESMAKQIPPGMLPSRKISVTDKPQEIRGQWKAVTLKNGGASAVYYFEHETLPTSLDAELVKGDTQTIDWEEYGEHSLWLVCDSGGTATVRMWSI
jgi:hypothetical protein